LFYNSFPYASTNHNAKFQNVDPDSNKWYHSILISCNSGIRAKGWQKVICLI